MEKAFIILLLASLSTTFLSGQTTTDYLIAYEDSTKGEYGLYGYQTVEREIVIAEQYPFIYTDTLYRVAMVITEDDGVVAIDRHGNILLKPFIFDNGPDYLSEGLFRFEENGKMGFADEDCNIVIPTQFDFVCPFGEGDEIGLTIYYLGGYKKYLDDEHWSWAGWNEEGYVNRSGQRFSKITNLINDKREAWTIDEKHVQLNEKGEITHTF